MNWLVLYCSIKDIFTVDCISHNQQPVVSASTSHLSTWLSVWLSVCTTTSPNLSQLPV